MNIIKQFTHNFQKPISAELFCVICKSIIIDAYQGICGCKYCRQCKEEHFVNNRKCPGDKEECSNSDISELVKDHGTNRKVSHLRVKCLNENCKFIDELRVIERHMTKCNKTYCPFSVIGCLQNDMNIEIMQTHLNNGTYKHSTLLMDSMKTIKNDSQQMYETILQKVDNVQIDFEEQLLSLKNESEKNEKEISLLHQKLNEFGQREQVKDGKIKKLEQMLEHTWKELNNFMDVQRSRNYIEESRLIIEYVHNQKLLKNANRMKQMELLTGKIELLETILKKENTFMWKVEKITETIKSAQLRENTDLFSEPFTAYKNGYLLKLKLTLNGYKATHGMYMSVFFRLEKGKYDELISWPVKDNIIINLINQDNGKSYVSQEFNYENANTVDRSSFDRPTENSQYYGRTRFIKISELFNSFLVKNDTIILTCYVKN